MSYLAQKAQEECADFMRAVDQLKMELLEKRAVLLQKGNQEAVDVIVAIQSSLFGLSSRAQGIKASVNAACMCSLVREAPTLEEVRQRVAHEEGTAAATSPAEAQPRRVGMWPAHEVEEMANLSGDDGE